MTRRLELVEPIHRCEIHVRNRGEGMAYALVCDLCGYVGTTKTMQGAETTAQLHEDFIAPLLKARDLPS